MKQIKNGGPVTVTDENMERYFMTIPEACSLVLQTGGVGKNGASYLLDMGEPVKIIDLAKQIIKFSGFEPYRDIDIEIIGKRPGERNIEPLWLKEENPSPTAYKKLLTLTNIPGKTFVLKELISKLEPICFFSKEKPELYRNKNELISILRKAIPTLDEFYSEQENLKKSAECNKKVVL